MTAAGLLLLILGTWLVLQAAAGDLAGRLLSWRYSPASGAPTGAPSGGGSGGGGGGGGSW